MEVISCIKQSNKAVSRVTEHGGLVTMKAVYRPERAVSRGQDKRDTVHTVGGRLEINCARFLKHQTRHN